MSVKHLVIFKFKPDTDPAVIDRIMRELAALVGPIPGLLNFQGGVYSGPYPGATGLNQGYTHGFVMTFQDAAARAAYLPHPEHVRFKDGLVPHLLDVVAFDFEAGPSATAPVDSTDGDVEQVDAWGGWTAGTLRATGRFRVDSWRGGHWLVTPAGHPLIGVGLAHANRQAPPSRPDSDRTSKLFGDDLDAYIIDRAEWMKRAGFNAFSYTTPEHAGVQVPWIATLPLMPGFINVGPKGFDPFDPAWRRTAADLIARELPPLLPDRRVIGVSLSFPVMASPHMVPDWMWERLGSKPTNLLRELKRLGADAPGKRAYVGYLAERHGDVAALFRARPNLPPLADSFDDLLGTDLATGEMPDSLHPDDAEFYAQFWSEAVRFLAGEIRRLAPDLLVLSPRIIGLRTFPDPWLDAWLAGVGPHVDVILPELYACNAYIEIVEHIGRLTGRPSFIADGMRPREFNYGEGPAVDRAEAEQYRRMFDDLLASRWFLGGTVCEYRPRRPDFRWYAEHPTDARTGVRRADYTEREPLLAAYREVHGRKYRTRVARLAAPASAP
jgi:hypothetical protein